jgi:hypothetical protein
VTGADVLNRTMFTTLGKEDVSIEVL